MSPSLRNRTALFAIWCAGLVAVRFDALQALYELSRQDETASHTVLVPLVTIGLLYQGRKTVFESLGTAWGVGFAMVAGGLALLAAAPAGAAGAGPALRWTIGALVVLWAGGFVLCYGAAAARAALFPLLFLVFTIPFPDALLDRAVLLLKNGSTEMVAGLFALTGTPFYREGYVFTLAGFTIEIADECSGIRSSIALVMTSLLAGHLFLGRLWAKALLVAAVLPLTIVKNGVRITGLSLLATHVDPGFLAGRLHHDGGIVFFALTLAMLAPVLGLLRRSELRLQARQA
jgi:exosortase